MIGFIASLLAAVALKESLPVLAVVPYLLRFKGKSLGILGFSVYALALLTLPESGSFYTGRGGQGKPAPGLLTPPCPRRHPEGGKPQTREGRTHPVGSPGRLGTHRLHPRYCPAGGLHLPGIQGGLRKGGCPLLRGGVVRCLPDPGLRPEEPAAGTRGGRSIYNRGGLARVPLHRGEKGSGGAKRGGSA